MKSSKTPHQRALFLQKKIFRSLKAEAEMLIGKTPDVIQKYEKENQRDFRIKSHVVVTAEKVELIESIRNADVTFIADFHTFEQAQRTALRIIRDAIVENEHWYVGLEMVPSHYQEHLDHYQSGRISSEKFLEAISYLDEWGFPWTHYEPIFEWCREHQIRMIALDRPKTFLPTPQERHDLHSRDQWAAGIITDLFHSDHLIKKKSRMIALFGELHVGSYHLPKQIKKISKPFLGRSLTTVSIHQNEDKLYWKLAEMEREIDTSIVSLKKNVYCVFSGTPWNKLQSLVNWAEGAELESGEYDDLSLLCSYGNTLSEFLRVNPPEYESISPHRVEQTGFLDILHEGKHFTREERRLIQLLVTQNQRVYIPKLRIVYVGSGSHNSLAEMAAVHLLRSRNDTLHFFKRTREDVIRMIFESTFGFFGSLVLNPKRKCDLTQDHQTRIQSLKETRKGESSTEFTARKLTLEMLDSPGLHFLDSFLTQRKASPSLFIGARYVGQIFGKKLHQALLTEMVPLKWIEQIFLNPSQDPSLFLESYQELFKVLEEIHIHPSKNDVL